MTIRPSVFRREHGEVSWLFHPTLNVRGRERYMGIIAKGWYAPTRRPMPGSRRRWPSIEVAIGGEDTMVQIGGSVMLAQGAVGVRVPRRLVKSWVYQRRAWGVHIGYIGSLARIEFAYDDGMDNMHDYYEGLATRRDEGIEGREEGYFPNRVERWPGWSCYVGGTNIPGRAKDRVLGKIERKKDVLEVKAVPIEMDGRVYTALGTLYDETSGRKRGQSLTRRWVELEFGPAPNDPPQFAGKGENSYDCDDDGIYGCTYETGNWSEAVRSYVADVERYRERYGQPSKAAV